MNRDVVNRKIGLPVHSIIPRHLADFAQFARAIDRLANGDASRLVPQQMFAFSGVALSRASAHMPFECP
jgi:hypothetical protein